MDETQYTNCMLQFASIENANWISAWTEIGYACNNKNYLHIGFQNAMYLSLKNLYLIFR